MHAHLHIRLHSTLLIINQINSTEYMVTLEIENKVREKGKKRMEKEKAREGYLQMHIPRHQAYEVHSNGTYITAKRISDSYIPLQV